MILSPHHIVVLLVAMESVNVQNPDRNPVIFSIACKIRKYKNMFLFNKKIQFLFNNNYWNFYQYQYNKFQLKEKLGSDVN